MLLIYWPQNVTVFYKKKGLTPTKKSLIKDQATGEDQVK